MEIEWFILALSLLLMLVGLVGIVLPSIPGIILIWTAVFFYGVLTDFVKIDNEFIIFISSLAFLAILLDYAENLWGTHRARTSVRVIIGAVIGGLIASTSSNIPIMLLGTFAGAIVGQHENERAFRHSSS